MAHITTRKALPVPPADIWDTIDGCELKLNREETKIVFLLLGQISSGASGKAGDHSWKLFNKIYDAVDPSGAGRALEDMNLALKLVDNGWDGEVCYKIVDKVTGKVL